MGKGRRGKEYDMRGERRVREDGRRSREDE